MELWLVKQVGLTVIGSRAYFKVLNPNFPLCIAEALHNSLNDMQNQCSGQWWMPQKINSMHSYLRFC